MKKMKLLGLETSMKGNNFVFDSIDRMNYKCINAVNLNCSGLYRDSPGWIKNKKATINPKNNDDDDDDDIYIYMICMCI